MLETELILIVKFMRLYRNVLEMSLACKFHFFARPKKKNRIHTNWNITPSLRGAMKCSVNQSKSARVHMLKWQGNHAKH